MDQITTVENAYWELGSARATCTVVVTRNEEGPNLQIKIVDEEAGAVGLDESRAYFHRAREEYVQFQFP